MKVDKCPNCSGKLVEHRLAGRGRYKEFPDLKVCTTCWHKYTVMKGKLMRVSNTGAIMGVVG